MAEMGYPRRVAGGGAYRRSQMNRCGPGSELSFGPGRGKHNGRLAADWAAHRACMPSPAPSLFSPSHRPSRSVSVRSNVPTARTACVVGDASAPSTMP
jgi:hypothetical protein